MYTIGITTVRVIMKSREQVIKMLTKMQGKGSQRQLAVALGVSPMFLNNVFNGKKDPGDKVLAKLGLERVVMYRKKA